PPWKRRRCRRWRCPSPRRCHPSHRRPGRRPDRRPCRGPGRPTRRPPPRLPGSSSPGNSSPEFWRARSRSPRSRHLGKLALGEVRCADDPNKAGARPVLEPARGPPYCPRVVRSLAVDEWRTPMRYKLLGNTGLRVAELALGTMTFGSDWGWGADKDESRAMFDAYAEAGGTPIEEMMRAIDDQVRAGKVLYVGISDAPAWVVARANGVAEARGWTPFCALQSQYSLVERNAERELLPMSVNLDLAFTAWGALG